jgi:hypothetical protein
MVSVLYSIFLFAACSGAGPDLVLPTNEIYKVDAYINESSLKVCSIIKQNDVIRPYFISSLGNDPDIQGLIVFLQTPSGTLVSKKTWYTIKTKTSESKPAAALSEPEEPPQVPVVFTPSSPAEDEPEPPAASEQTLRENVIEDLSEYDIVEVSRLDQDLPGFTLTEPMAIGQYIMVFQVLGEKELLYAIEKPIYFLGDAELALTDMRYYLPGIPANPHLVPPGIKVILEAEISADQRLDPYIIWYDGKKRIGEGKVSSGAHQLIWKVPERTGFHTIKSVVFPFEPIQNSNLNGASRELSLPISARTKNTGYFAYQAEQFAYWYRFESNLVDSKAPSDAKRALHPQSSAPRWVTYNSMYGLGVGNDDQYLLTEPLFIFDPKQEVSGNIASHLLPLSDGTILAFGFQTFDKIDHSPLSPLVLRLSAEGQNLILALTRGETSYHASLDLTDLEPQSFITLNIAFTVRQSQISARVTLEETGLVTNEITLTISDVITGEGTFQLGEIEDKPAKTVALFNELGVAFTKTPISSESAFLEPDPKTQESPPVEVQTKLIAETPHETETT